MDATSPDPRRDERARDDVTHQDTTHDTRHTEPVRGDGVHPHPGVRRGGGPRSLRWRQHRRRVLRLAGGRRDDRAADRDRWPSIATAVGYSNDITQTDAERAAGTVTLVTAIVLLAILLIAYYSGGYVAGRMSRFDGARQGLMVWVIGLLVTLLAVALGWVAGDQYNLLDRVDVPRIPIPSDDITLGGIITAIAVLVGTLLAAMFGGTVGRRYHSRVDRAAAEPIV